MSAEEWRAIPGFPYYEVSSLGRIKSHCHRWKQPRLLNPRPSGNGYRVVYLASESGGIYRSVHGLVARAFHGPRPSPEMQVRHLNGDKLDCRAENLAWGTPSENAMDSVRHGVHPNARKTECVHGHPFDEVNTYVDANGRRHCRPCRARVVRELRARRARQRAA